MAMSFDSCYMSEADVNQYGAVNASTPEGFARSQGFEVKAGPALQTPTMV